MLPVVELPVVLPVVALPVVGLLLWLIWRRREAIGQVRSAAVPRIGTAEIDRFFEHSGDLLVIVGLDGHFKQMNPA